MLLTFEVFKKKYKCSKKSSSNTECLPIDLPKFEMIGFDQLDYSESIGVEIVQIRRLDH